MLPFPSQASPSSSFFAATPTLRSEYPPPALWRAFPSLTSMLAHGSEDANDCDAHTEIDCTADITTNEADNAAYSSAMQRRRARFHLDPLPPPPPPPYHGNDDDDADPFSSHMICSIECVAHALLLLAVAALGGERAAASRHIGWVLSPACASDDAPAMMRLDCPAMPRRALGLFSEVNVAAACLSAQAATTALALRWPLGLLPLLFGAALLPWWQVPPNNLLWLGGMLLATALGIWRPLRMASTLLVLPTLCIAALVDAGEGSVPALVASFGGLCALGLLCAALDDDVPTTAVVVAEVDYDDDHNAAIYARRRGLRPAMGLCLLPFVFFGMRRATAPIALALACSVCAAVAGAAMLWLDQTRAARLRDPYAAEVRVPARALALLQRGAHGALATLLLLLTGGPARVGEPLG